MSKLQIRVVPDPPNGFRWIIVDHVWDSISAPIAMGAAPLGSYGEALLEGTAALEKMVTEPARDHPLQD